MSYTIAVVVPPVSSQDADAWNELDSLIEREGSPPVVFRDFHDRLTAQFPCLSSLPDDQIDDSVWSDGPLWNNFGHRVAVLGLMYSRIEEALPFLIESANSLGLVVFDWVSEEIHRGDGLKGFTLSVQDRIVVPSPRIERVFAVVDQLTPDGGPGFMSLDGPGRDYIQVAGGNGVFTVEWREYSDEQFRHWVLGHRGAQSDQDVSIAGNGFDVSVKENEQLSSDDVKTLLSAYVERNGHPENFERRETTDQF